MRVISLLGAAVMAAAVTTLAAQGRAVAGLPADARTAQGGAAESVPPSVTPQGNRLRGKNRPAWLTSCRSAVC